MRNVPRLVAVAVMITAALGLTACQANDRPSDKPPRGDTVTPVTVAPSGAAAKGGSESEKTPCTAADVEVSGQHGEKPSVTIPRDCAAPESLLAKDLVHGSGKPAAPHDTVVVRYQLTTWSDGKVADGNFDTGDSLAVRNLGSADVIKGWNEGLEGAKKGARRLLIVPPALGYGDTGKGTVKPGETLVFVIDVLKVSS